MRIGVVGLGKAFMLMLPTFLMDRRVQLVAASDTDPLSLRQFKADFPAAAVHGDIESLCKNPDVEVVYIGTPHQFHAVHAEIALNAGKHVLVEKPMAVTLEDCCRMNACAQAAGKYLIVGHSHSFDHPISRAKELIDSGRYGRVRFIHSMNYTDFLYRPRRAEELNTDLGGGVVFNQASHQLDVIRLLAQGRVVDVSSYLGRWDAARRTEGAYSALIKFDNGVAANVTYSGYAHYNSDEVMGWVNELGEKQPERRLFPTRLRLDEVLNKGSEAAYKNEMSYGRGWSAHGLPKMARNHQHFGHLVISCEGADIVPKAEKIEVFANGEYHCENFSMPDFPRQEVMDELFDAISGTRPPVHTGEWAMETLDLCIALLEGGKPELIGMRATAVACAGRSSGR